MTINIAICDDNQYAREENYRLVSSLERRNNDLKILEFSNGIELLRMMDDENSERLHIILMDVDFGGTLDGYSISELIRKRTDDVEIIFFTGKDVSLPAEYVKIRPSGYILKSDSTSQKLEQLQLVLDRMTSIPRKIKFRSEYGTFFFLPLNDIIYFTRYRRKVWICTVNDLYDLPPSNLPDDEIFLTKETMQELYNRVGSLWFEFASSRYLVNLAKVVSIRSGSVQLVNNKSLHLGRQCESEFRKRYIEYVETPYNMRYE